MCGQPAGQAEQVREVAVRAVLPARAPDALVASRPGGRARAAARRESRCGMPSTSAGVHAARSTPGPNSDSTPSTSTSSSGRAQARASRIARATCSGSSHIGTCPQPCRRDVAGLGQPARARAAPGGRRAAAGRARAQAIVVGQAGIARPPARSPRAASRPAGRARGAWFMCAAAAAGTLPRARDDQAHQRGAAHRAAVGGLGVPVERARHRVDRASASRARTRARARPRSRSARSRRRCPPSRGGRARARSRRRASCRPRAGARARAPRPRRRAPRRSAAPSSGGEAPKPGRSTAITSCSRASSGTTGSQTARSSPIPCSSTIGGPLPVRVCSSIARQPTA